MAAAFDLEGLREVFADRRTYNAIAKILRIEIAPSRSQVRAECLLLTQDRKVIVRVAWPASGTNAGWIQLPQVGDLVLVTFAEGDDEQALITARLSSAVDTIPTQALDGSLVARALAGKLAFLMSDTGIMLGRGGANPDEPLVLGNMLKALLVDLITLVASLADKVSTHTHIDSLGGITQVPIQTANFTTIKSDANTLKASPVNDDLILSDFAFTEK